MHTPEDDIITNSDESTRLPDENPEPLEGVKKEESNLLEAESKENKSKTDTTKTETKSSKKDEMK